MSLAPKSFSLNVSQSIATITLARPERLNALTFEVYRELRDTMRAISNDTQIRVVVITGSGRAFCSGGDVEDIIGALFARDQAGLLEFTTLTCELIASICECRQIVIASLNGTVAGAGAVIASACDLRVANEHAKIAYLFTKVGLAGADMGAAWLLPRLIGHSRARELLLCGDFIDAKRAYEVGLYHRLCAADQLQSETLKLAEKFATGPFFAQSMTKQLLYREAHVDLSTALIWEAQAQAMCMQHPDFRAAYEAFRDKTPVKFS